MPEGIGYSLDVISKFRSDGEKRSYAFQASSEQGGEVLPETFREGDDAGSGLPASRHGQMAFHAQQREQLLDAEIQVGDGHSQYRFDLSLKRLASCRINRRAPCCGFF